LADLSMREIVTPDPAVDRVAVGAAAQAAGVLLNEQPDIVGARWASADQVIVITEPKIDAELSAELRSRYLTAAVTAGG
jgi:hypothetical protein